MEERTAGHRKRHEHYRRAILLTVPSHAVGDGGGRQGVALLRVDELADGGQFVHAVHFAKGRRAGPVG